MDKTTLLSLTARCGYQLCFVSGIAKKALAKSVGNSQIICLVLHEFQAHKQPERWLHYLSNIIYC